MKKAILLLFLSALTLSCNDSNSEDNNQQKIEKLLIENDSLKKALTPNTCTRKNQISTFLTFQDNNAENAMNFYIELFDNSKIINIERWGKDAPSEEGRIMFAQFTINGNLFMCSDSPPIHDWNFSPAVSNFVECENESEQERLFSKLSENGTVTMPLNNYGFS
tara:strand:+ start:412 stop:903 length:492 start_codon:yes stop_codon:yes gene_type:complete